MESKACTGCKKDLPISEYHYNRKQKRYFSKCKICTHEINKRNTNYQFRYQVWQIAGNCSLLSGYINALENFGEIITVRPKVMVNYNDRKR